MLTKGKKKKNRNTKVGWKLQSGSGCELYSVRFRLLSTTIRIISWGVLKASCLTGKFGC